MGDDKNRELARFFLTLAHITYGVLVLGTIVAAPLRVRLLLLGLALVMSFFTVALIFLKMGDKRG